jgi:hypothetical protein
MALSLRRIVATFGGLDRLHRWWCIKLVSCITHRDYRLARRPFSSSYTHGIAGFPSAEAHEVGADYPYVRVSRAFVRQTIDLGGETQKLEAVCRVADCESPRAVGWPFLRRGRVRYQQICQQPQDRFPQLVASLRALTHKLGRVNQTRESALPRKRQVIALQRNVAKGTNGLMYCIKREGYAVVQREYRFRCGAQDQNGAMGADWTNFIVKR